MAEYGKVTPEIVAELHGICGPEYVIYNDPEAMEGYSRDESPGKKYGVMPEAVVRPTDAAQIAAIMQLANRERIPVTPRGAGSGLSGGAVPVYGGIVLATDRMNRILELDRPNMMIVVEPGVIANDINEFLREYKLFYAGYPMSLETCFIGGNIAENAGGGKAVKYGVTARYVLGLEVVTPTGKIVEYGGKLLKDVTGFNMVQLMVGSEGTLGVVTKIILKLLPLPAYQTDLLCLFDSPERAIALVPEIITNTGITPTSIEFMDSASVRTSCKYLNESLPYDKCGAMLLITVDGVDRAAVERDYETVGLYCQENGASEVYVADNPLTSERIWKIRKNIPDAYNIYSTRQSGEDLVVPPASIPFVLKKLYGIAESYGVIIPCYGHAGDGNIHARIICPPDWSNEKWQQILPEILKNVYTDIATVGGRISGEHGIGCKRKDYMKYVVSEEYLDVLRAIKKALDPNNILNPGKIIDIFS